MEIQNKIFLFGLDNAGKSTLLKYMREEKVEIDLPPSREFDIVEMFIKDLFYQICDVPGQNSYREKWFTRLPDSTILIFVLDVADKERFGEAKQELDKILADEDAKDLPLLFCCHKIDLKEAQDNLKNAISSLNLTNIKNREVYWLTTSVFTIDGVNDLKLMLFQLALRLETQRTLANIQNKYKI